MKFNKNILTIDVPRELLGGQITPLFQLFNFNTKMFDKAITEDSSLPSNFKLAGKKFNFERLTSSRKL